MLSLCIISALIASNIHCASVNASFSRFSLNPDKLRTSCICVRSLLRASSSCARLKVSNFNLRPKVFSSVSFSFFEVLLIVKSSVVFIFFPIQICCYIYSDLRQTLCVVSSRNSTIPAFAVPSP